MISLINTLKLKKNQQQHNHLDTSSFWPQHVPGESLVCILLLRCPFLTVLLPMRPHQIDILMTRLLQPSRPKFTSSTSLCLLKRVKKNTVIKSAPNVRTHASSHKSTQMFCPAAQQQGPTALPVQSPCYLAASSHYRPNIPLPAACDATGQYTWAFSIKCNSTSLI